MVIGGHEYTFLYTVGAYLAIHALKLPAKMAPSDQAKFMFSYALILSKEAEDAKKLDNPDYEPHPLTAEVLKTLPLKDFGKLADEVNAAMLDGMERTVEAEADSKKNGAVKA